MQAPQSRISTPTHAAADRTDVEAGGEGLAHPHRVISHAEALSHLTGAPRKSPQVPGVGKMTHPVANKTHYIHRGVVASSSGR